MEAFLAWLLAALIYIPRGVSLQIPFIPQHLDTQDNTPNHGAVASESKACSQIGVDLIKAGGNAADAVVGTTFCIGVVSPYHSGIGGGGFALIRAPNGTYEALDFRETAPARAHVHMFEGNVLGSIYGGLASGVPGEVKGLEYIHNSYGKLPWAKVISPAIELARYGFPVSFDLARGMNSKNEFLNHNDFLTEDPTWAMDFAPNGTKLTTGDIITRKRYADTLESIAFNGADVFYKGILANLTIRAIQRTNGTMTMQDLADYKVISRPAVSIDFYTDYKLFGCGAPASGAVALSILQTVSGYASSTADPILKAHRLVEAMRFAYGQRASMGDPDFLPNMSAYEAHMLSPAYGAATRSKILDSTTQNISAYNPSGFEIRNSHGTSHISAADSTGLGFSLTTTVNLYFGSTVMVPETGIILNNEMNDFSIPGVTNAFGYAASPANYVQAGKRSLSSIAPVIVEKLGDSNGAGKRKTKGKGSGGSLYAVLGAAGGSRIITAVAQNVLDLLLPPSSSSSEPPSSSSHGNLSKVLARSRLHDQLLPNILRIERGGSGVDVDVDADEEEEDDDDDDDDDDADEEQRKLVRGLEAKGHKVEWTERGYSACQGVIFVGEKGGTEGHGRPETGKWFAEGEPRQRDSGGCVV